MILICHALLTGAADVAMILTGHVFVCVVALAALSAAAVTVAASPLLHPPPQLQMLRVRSHRNVHLWLSLPLFDLLNCSFIHPSILLSIHPSTFVAETEMRFVSGINID